MALGAALAGVLAVSRGASAGTITVNVPVKLSKLANELKQFDIQCSLLHNNKPYDVTQPFESAQVFRNITSNGFDGTVPVPVPYSDVAASQITGYHCELWFVDPTPGGFWLQPTPQGTGKPIQQALPGFVNMVDGKLLQQVSPGFIPKTNVKLP
jgi:hypothetical protein